MKTTSLLLAVLAFVVVGPTVSNAGELDLSKTLVGKWEGEFVKEARDQFDHRRTLIIGEVRQQDGKWIVEKAKFGITGEGLGAVKVTLEATDSAPTLRFETGAGNPVLLRLTTEGTLAGTISLRGVLRSNPQRPITLKKIE